MIANTLLTLRDDRTELPAALRHLVGSLHPRTYDEAVRLLLRARHAPTDPQCLSYRAALYLLQGLDPDDAPGAGVQTAPA